MSRMFRRQKPTGEPPRNAAPSSTARAANPQRGWQANEPNQDLRSVWGTHRTAKIVLFLAFILAAVGVLVYVFTSISG